MQLSARGFSPRRRCRPWCCRTSRGPLRPSSKKPVFSEYTLPTVCASCARHRERLGQSEPCLTYVCFSFCCFPLLIPEAVRVITVPAYFNDSQRAATKAAGHSCQCTWTRCSPHIMIMLINELKPRPTAAADLDIDARTVHPLQAYVKLLHMLRT